MADFEVGLGDPTKPKLTDEESKRVDENHNPILSGLAWSEAKSDLYLTVYGSTREVKADIPFAGETLFLSPILALTVGCSMSKPRFNVPGWGASLELPIDLGKDEYKKAYVMEWLVGMAKDVLLEFDHPGFSEERSQQLAIWLFMTANAAINKGGL